MNTIIDESQTPAQPTVPGAIGNVQKVADVAVHPGEDSTLDRTWGGWKALKAYIASATTTKVKQSAGVLHTVVLGETAAGPITIYDNVTSTGTPMAVLKTSIGEGTFIFDCEFTAGLTIVTGAASKLTVNYL